MTVLPVGVWDQTQWNQSAWYQPTPPSTAGWGQDWRWWYQYPGWPPFAVQELTGMVVEARWTTDSHSMGDGTFRGDLQPGRLTLQLWDPQHAIDNLPLNGLIYAHYRPAGLTFAWFVDSVSRGLYESGNPLDADCVVTGAGWPERLIAGNASFSRGTESVTARLNAVASAISGKVGLPTVAADLDAQSQNVGPTVADGTTGLYPSYLQAIRDASVYGVAWLDAVGAATVGSTGTLALRYRRWENTRFRALDPGQIVAGTVITRATAYILTQVQYVGDDPATAAVESAAYTRQSGTTGTYGIIGVGPMRVFDKLDGTGTTYPALDTLAGRILADHATAPAAGTLSSFSCQSGPRWTPAGRPSTAVWDPAAHVWSPADIADRVEPAAAGGHQYYRVAHSEHVLNAKTWQTAHTVEVATTPPALP